MPGDSDSLVIMVIAQFDQFFRTKVNRISFRHID